jgi:hypothetical protein
VADRDRRADSNTIRSSTPFRISKGCANTSGSSVRHRRVLGSTVARYAETPRTLPGVGFGSGSHAPGPRWWYYGAGLLSDVWEDYANAFRRPNATTCGLITPHPGIDAQGRRAALVHQQ